MSTAACSGHDSIPDHSIGFLHLVLGVCVCARCHAAAGCRVYAVCARPRWQWPSSRGFRLWRSRRLPAPCANRCVSGWQCGFTSAKWTEKQLVPFSYSHCVFVFCNRTHLAFWLCFQVNDWRTCTLLLLTAIRGESALSCALALQYDGIEKAGVFASSFGRRIRRALSRFGTVPSSLAAFGTSHLSMSTSSALFSSSASFKSLSEPPSASSNALRAYVALLDRLVHRVEPAPFCELIPDDGTISYVPFPWLF